MGMSREPVPIIVSALEARTQLGQIMRRAGGAKQERFIVDRRGVPKVVILGFRDFLETLAPQPAVMAAVRAHARGRKTDRLTTRAIEREIKSVRRARKK